MAAPTFPRPAPSGRGPATAASMTAAAPVSLANVQTAGRKLPIRMCLYSVEGYGKTSFGAQCPNPIFLMARDETGLETLIDSGQLPETPHMPAIESWLALRATVQALIDQEHPYKSLVLDTINGLERLCHEHVCQRDFNGDWGEKGFMSYQKGPEVALTDWLEFLQQLDTLRETKGMRVVMLAHCRIKAFKNPEGPDYDRYEADMNAKTWSVTHKWLDMCLFGNYFVDVKSKDPNRKGKATGGQQRVLYTQRTAAYDAKNRHGLPEMIYLPDTPAASYRAFVEAMKEGAKANQPQ